MIVTINTLTINFLTLTTIDWQVDKTDQITGATVSFTDGSSIQLAGEQAQALYGAVRPQQPDSRIVKPDIRLN